MTTGTRKAVFFVLLAAAWIVFTGIFLVSGHDHDCAGEHCPICLEMRISQRIIESLYRFGAGFVLLGFFRFVVRAIKPPLTHRAIQSCAPRLQLNC